MSFLPRSFLDNLQDVLYVSAPLPGDLLRADFTGRDIEDDAFGTDFDGRSGDRGGSAQSESREAFTVEWQRGSQQQAAAEEA